MSHADFLISFGIVVTSNDPRAPDFALLDDDGDMVLANGNPVVHFVGFEHQPTKADYETVKADLEADEEFCLEGMPFEMFEATPEAVEFFKNHVPCDEPDKPTLH